MAARARKHGESFKAYRSNLNKEAKRDKEREKGRMLWVSSYIDKSVLINPANRTYDRSKHGELR